MRTSTSARLLAFGVAATAWSALLAQYALLLAGTWNEPGPWQATLRYFSFFTILSNLLVALAATSALRSARRADVFADAVVLGGVASCIALTGLVYFFVLSSTWAPTGAQWLVDKALHYVTPVAYLGWWALAAEHGRLRWSDPTRWLLFPGVFLLWSLLHGAWSGWYPYPFLEVGALGYAAVLRNGVVVGVLFGALGLLVVAVDRALARRPAVVPPAPGDAAE